MNFENRLNAWFLSLIIVLPVAYTTLTTWQITASDWLYRHSVWTASYLRGVDAIYEYPPLFHWLMLPFVAMNFPVVLFQILFSVLNVLVIYWFLKKFENDDALIYAMLFCASSLIYMQFSSALMPQALDLLLFLPIVYFYTNRKPYKSLLIFIPLFLLHMTSLIFAFLMFAWSLYKRDFRYAALLVVVVLAFSPLYYFYVVPPTYIDRISVAVPWDMEAQIKWESWFYDPWWHFFATSGILAWLYLPKALYIIKRNIKLSEMQKFYLLWILCFLPTGMGISWYPTLSIGYGELWRMMGFVIVPMYFFIASLVSDKNDSKMRPVQPLAADIRARAVRELLL